MKRIIVLSVLWLACTICIFSTHFAIARSWLSKTVTGKVLDQDTNLPVVASLKISVNGFSPVEAMSDSLGQFSVSLPDATSCIITVEAKGFDSQEETIEISNASTNYVEIYLAPQVKLTMEGKVFGSTPFEEKPLDGTVTVYLNSDFIKEDSAVVSQGRYSEAFTNFGWYIIDFSAPGFADARDTVWVMNSNRKVLHKDYYLVPLNSKLTTALNNIQFNFDQSTLNPDSFVELDYLGQFLKHNPDKQVEITGYTDNRGPKEYNMILSKARAQSVVEYLKAKGVNSDQLISKANGDSNPIVSNANAVGAARNRRVELLVTSKLVFENASAETKSIRFAFGKTSLDADSYSELNRLVEKSAENSSIRFEISGHTDSTGPDDYNEILANARAQVVVDYLKAKGVDARHVAARSYGARKPIDSNSTPEGQANNRRVEITLLNQ